MRKLLVFTAVPLLAVCLSLQGVQASVIGVPVPKPTATGQSITSSTAAPFTWTPVTLPYGLNGTGQMAVGGTVDATTRFSVNPTGAAENGVSVTMPVSSTGNALQVKQNGSVVLAVDNAGRFTTAVQTASNLFVGSLPLSIITPSYSSIISDVIGGSNPAGNVFDGNTGTFYDAGTPTATSGWVGVDFGAGTPQTVTQVVFFPRIGYESKLLGAQIQTSNDLTTWVVQATIATTPADVYTTLPISSPVSARYIRLWTASVTGGGGASSGNVAELSFQRPGTDTSSRLSVNPTGAAGSGLTVNMPASSTGNGLTVNMPASSTGNALTVKQSGNANATLSPTGVLTLGTTGTVGRINLFGNGNSGGSQSNAGISLLMNYNQAGNTQFVIAPSGVPSNAGYMLRTFFYGNNTIIDSVSGNNQNSGAILFGNGQAGSNVAFGYGADYTPTALATFGTKFPAQVVTSINAASGQTADLLDLNDSTNAVLAKIDSNFKANFPAYNILSGGTTTPGVTTRLADGSAVTGGIVTGAPTTATANTILAGPVSGAAAIPTLRALVPLDIPASLAGTGLTSTAGVLSVSVPVIMGSDTQTLSFNSIAGATRLRVNTNYLINTTGQTAFGGAIDTSTRLSVNPQSAGEAGVVVTIPSGSRADALTVKNSTGSVIASITSTGRFTNQGGLRSVTATDSTTSADTVLLCNGTFTESINSGYPKGFSLTIINIGTGTITISGGAFNPINGSTSNIVLSTQYQSRTIMNVGDSNVANYVITSTSL